MTPYQFIKKLIHALNDEEKRLLIKELLPEEVKLLSEDDTTASHHHKVTYNLDTLIPQTDDTYHQYFGERVTVYKNRQGTPNHPKSFLCYITIPEAKLLRSLGLGYSLNTQSNEWEQHVSREGIPSFQGGDGGSGGDGGGSGGRGGGGNDGGNDGGDGGLGSSGDGGLGAIGNAGASGVGGVGTNTSGGGGDGGLGALGLGGYGMNTGQIDGSTFGGFNSSGDAEHFGTLGSLASKLTGSYAIGQTVDTAVSLAGAFSGLQNAMLGLSFGGVLGFGVAGIGIAGALSSIDHLGVMNGSSSSDESGFSGSDFGGRGDGHSLTDTVASEEIALSYARNIVCADISNRDVFEKMAGGIVYQGVFAGGFLFDATRSPNTNFSVGVPYEMSEHALRIHAPYQQFEAKNQAGTSSFSVLR